MEQLGKVSIWIGNFKNQKLLNQYIREVYDEEWDCSSDFMQAFQIEDIDPQFREVDFDFRQMSLKQRLDGFSYAASFKEKIKDIEYSINTIICLYDFEYFGVIKTSKELQFLGAFEYKKEI